MLTACFCLNKRLPKEGVAELFVENMTSQKRFEGKCLPDNYMDGFDEEMEEYAPTRSSALKSGTWTSSRSFTSCPSSPILLTNLLRICCFLHVAQSTGMHALTLFLYACITLSFVHMCVRVPYEQFKSHCLSCSRPWFHCF